MGRVVWTSAFAVGVAFAHPGRCGHPRTADRFGRDRQVGPDPPVHLPGAVRPERSAVRQGHRLLPLLAAGLRRGQELAAVDPAAGRPDGRRDLLPARRHQSGSSALGVSSAAIAHGSALLGLYFAVKAWSYALDRYLLLYNDNGVVVGAGYTDVHVELPALWLLIGLAAVAAIVAWANVRLRTSGSSSPRPCWCSAARSCFAETHPRHCFERFFVKPSELQLETPYIQQNIALTREAYNLGQITVKPFPAEQDLTFQSLKDNSGTIDNIRLWDWQPLMDTYAQLQEIRTYYRFLDVDVDRYHLGGSYQQVTLAARELDPSLLSANAQTWVNLHLLFTHGNGVVMSPVTQKSAEGLPIFYLKDIPPVATGGPPITEPRIYFGQGAWLRDRQKQHAGVRLSQGKGQRLRRYDGADGIPIGGIAWRALFAWHMDDLNILLSGYITSESRILLHRNIQDRVRDDRAVPSARSRPLRGDQRRAALLDAGRLHDERTGSPMPSRNPTATSTTSAIQ